MATRPELLPPDDRPRCGWATSDPLYIAYHDEEWGTPCRDDDELFERLMLEGFQAGLSWITILRKRDAFSRAFDGWNARVIAAYGEDDIARLLADPGIVRNRLKVRGAVQNARAYLALKDDRGSFSDYCWDFVDGEPIVNRPRALGDVPATTPLATTISKDLRKRGFTFVGPTIVYAFMQSVGMVDDHLVTCFRCAPES
ncbi:MAG: DNA-3-methyladenine glycosylase I [Thermomicrobiales bacterium]